MRIAEALPSKMYTNALKRSQEPEFAALIDSTIDEIRGYWADSSWNRKVKPGVHFSYGKDSMAVAILLKMAGIKEFELLSINNRSHLPVHELVWSEFDAWYGDCDQITYETKDRFVDYLYYFLNWGKAYEVHKYSSRKGETEPVNYWNWGAMGSAIAWETTAKWQTDYCQGESDLLILWGNRSAEAMNRAFEINNYGRFYLYKKDGDRNRHYRCQPIGHWKNLDVWALLVKENCPVSEIYSYHAIPQKTGNGSFPRTLNYAAPETMSSTYYKWLARYAPVLIQELCTMFPEILQKLKKKG